MSAISDAQPPPRAHAPATGQSHGQSPGALMHGRTPVQVPIRAEFARPREENWGWTGTRRVAAVSPCFNRPADAELLVDDLLNVDRRGIDLRFILVDNASTIPLSGMRVGIGEHAGQKPWFGLEHLRLEDNTGGSGGYNAGMRRALEYARSGAMGPGSDPWVADYIWMVDSDVRVSAHTLHTLIEVMEADKSIVAAGSAIADPLTGQTFELGGFIHRKAHWAAPYVTGNVGVRDLIDVDYLAVCCALIRADAVRMLGVMPDRFLHYDDIEWTRRLGDVSGGRVVGVPWSVAMHPHFSRYSSWVRYYSGRSAIGSSAMLGGGMSVRARRAWLEVRRGIQQALNDRPDIARLHIRALRDAARGIVTGPAPKDAIKVEPMLPLARIGQELDKVLTKRGVVNSEQRSRLSVGIRPALLLTHAEESQVFEQLSSLGMSNQHRTRYYRRSFIAELFEFAGRFLGVVPRPDIAVVPVRGQAFCWLAAPITLQVYTTGFVLREPRRFSVLRSALATTAKIFAAQIHATIVPPPAPRMYPAEMGRPEPREPSTAAASLPVTPIVLAHNRPDALRVTLDHLAAHPLFSARSRNTIVVADNGSRDRGFPDLSGTSRNIRVTRFASNLGVEAFNRAASEAQQGAAAADQHLLLILDDDARVEPDHLTEAVELMAARPDLSAVTFHPRHPVTSASEWPFANQLRRRPRDRAPDAACVRSAGYETDDHWPVMGCANLIRASVWEKLGGYEAKFFLYRNDTDLALRILSSGGKVHFNPDWVVWHDTPAEPGAKKSTRWHRLATRNWVWTCKRNASGATRFKAAALGYLNAHRLAGLSASRHIATLRGGLAGALTAAPALRGATKPDSRHLARLLDLQIAERRAQRARSKPPRRPR